MRARSRRMRRGVSDLIVVLVMAAIAIPVAFAVQSWLQGQASKVSEQTAIPEISGTLTSKELRNGTLTVTIKLKNNSDSDFRVTDVSIVSSDGTTTSAQYSTIPAGGTVSPGQTLVIVATGSVSSPQLVVITLTSDTGATTTVEIPL